MEILFFEPVYKDYIWGGTRLKEYFGKNISTKTAAESWEISTNEDGLSKIKNKNMHGITLKDLFDDTEKRIDIFGTKTKNMSKFPLLIKFIDANTNLSVQVHPNDDYAKKYENDTGKTEMWHIIDCNSDAKIICGMKENVKKEDVEKIIRNNQIKENLNYVDIKKGDTIYIPAGTIHAILGNTLLCEIQQNSNLTYRVYDWDRVGKDGKPRQLHIDKAIRVINVQSNPSIKHDTEEECVKIMESEFFTVEKINVNGTYCDNSSKGSFYAMNVIDGDGVIEDKTGQYEVKKGDSFLIPSNLGEYKIVGNLKILKSYID